MKRGNTTVAMPTGAEQLRMKLTVLANALIMKMKHAARNELKDITPAFFEKYKDYLLGDYVYGLRASDDYGGMIPPWTLVLRSLATQKHCYKIMVQQRMPFKLALEKSWKDATVKERHFTTPLALYAKRGYTATSSAATATPGDKGGARIRARARARRGIPELPLTSRYASATTPKEAARRKLSATLSARARYALVIILLQSVRRRKLRIPRARLTDKCRRLRQLERQRRQLLATSYQCYTCLLADHDRVI